MYICRYFWNCKNIIQNINSTTINLFKLVQKIVTKSTLKINKHRMLQHFYAHNKHKKVRIVGNCNVSRLLFNPIFAVFPRKYLLRNKADASSLWTRLSKQYIADFHNENCTLQHHHMVTFKKGLDILQSHPLRRTRLFTIQQ